MQRRMLGRTGVEVAVLGFGCGAVGGLMVRGTPADQERAVARALELGINYFDTAPIYGDGESEKNLGRVLRSLMPDVVVGTKVRLSPDEMRRIGPSIAASLDASLGRLGLERVDLLQLHNPISEDGAGRTIAASAVLGEVVPALDALRRQGKIRFLGITALGDTPALHRVIDARVLDTAQVCFNLLNPSAAVTVPPGYPAQDFGQLLARTRAAGMGTIGISVLAGGALSGVEERHPLGIPSVEPIASGPDYAADVGRARRLDALVREGHAESLVEAGIRFALSSEGISTVLVGYSTLDHLETAARAMNKGGLSPAALDRLAELWRSVR